MATVFSIVEGDGDVVAVPILLRRIALELLHNAPLTCLQPFRLPRTKLLKPHELGRALNLGRNKLRGADPPSFLLLLMDSEADCPKQLVESILDGFKDELTPVPTSIVFAVHEFEAWFLAASMNEAHHSSLRQDAEVAEAPEAIKDAKGYLRQAMLKPGRSYKETVDQPKLASCMDLHAAQRRSPSFDKLVREMQRHLGPR